MFGIFNVPDVFNLSSISNIKVVQRNHVVQQRALQQRPFTLIHAPHNHAPLHEKDAWWLMVDNALEERAEGTRALTSAIADCDSRRLVATCRQCRARLTLGTKVRDWLEVVAKHFQADGRRVPGYGS